MAVWEEAFADRGYRSDGSLVPRGEPGALLRSVAEVSERIRGLIEGRGIVTVEGGMLPLHPRTLCVHGDTPGAVRFAKAAAKVLDLPVR